MNILTIYNYLDRKNKGGWMLTWGHDESLYEWWIDVRRVPPSPPPLYMVATTWSLKLLQVSHDPLSCKKKSTIEALV